MEIHFLEDHTGFIPQLAAWCHAEWKDFYGGKTVEDVRAYFAANTSRDLLPITYVALEEGRLRRGHQALVIVGAAGVSVGFGAFTF